MGLDVSDLPIVAVNKLPWVAVIKRGKKYYLWLYVSELTIVTVSKLSSVVVSIGVNM